MSAYIWIVQACGFAIEYDFATIHDRGVVRNPASKFQILFHQNDRPVATVAQELNGAGASKPVALPIPTRLPMPSVRYY
ncbi:MULTISPECIES: hypothetical protein [Mesorhizobium]|uniref:hypothetical protein n=1 Tax=Mesorhizobium TaxID=68287 RepID=UPI00131472B1|nr:MULTISPECIES: hypothetical protein [Mesorhizobium]